MALVLKDRVKQTTTTTGTGSIVLNGTIDGFQTFAAALTNGDTTYYGIFEPSTNKYEVGLGTWTESTATLARTTVLESSNSGSAVSLTAQAEVFITQPAEKAVFLNSSDVSELGDGLKVDSASGSITVTAEDGSGNVGVTISRDGISPISTITVTVANPGAGNRYYLDGALQQTAILKPSVTYRFDQSDNSNSGHPLRFSTTSDGTHNSGSEFTTGVTTSGSPGSAGAYTEVRFEQDVAAKLYYYCSAHSGMGGAAETKSISTTGGAFTGAVTGTNLTLSGDLTVNGTTTTVNTTNMVVSDALIELANGTTGTPANDAGLVIERGSADNAFIGYDESADKFVVGTGSFTGASTGDLTISTGTLVANVEGNVTGDVTGNADTATALETARNIGGVSFDGTANINLPGVNTAGNQDTSGNAATATALATARNIAVTGAVTGNANFDGSGNISIATTATSDPTVTLTGAVTGSGTMTNLGNVSIATTATADPTLTLSGDASGSATFTNLGNATLSVMVADDSHNHVISNVDGLQTALDGKLSTSGTAADSNLLDGIDSASFLRSDAADDATQRIVFSANATNNWDTIGTSTGSLGSIEIKNDVGDAFMAFHVGGDYAAYFGLDNSTNDFAVGGWSMGNNQYKVWHQGNDGSGSGLDADLWDGNQFSTYLNQAVLTSSSPTFNNAYIAGQLYHSGDTDTYLQFATNTINLVTGNSTSAIFNSSGIFLTDGSVAEDYDALSGTSPTCNVDNGGAFSLTMSGNTTFTFSGASSGYIQGFVLQLTGNGSTVTWPSSVKWAGGTAPDAPASGETDILVFHTRDGGTNWYGVLASDAAA